MLREFKCPKRGKGNHARNQRDALMKVNVITGDYWNNPLITRLAFHCPNELIYFFYNARVAGGA